MKKTLLIIIYITISGCSKKVDCEKFRDRVLKCTPEIMKKLDLKNKDMKKWEKLLDEKLLKSCEVRNGKVGDVKKINDCLSKDNCEKFVFCLFELSGKN
jgi:hypothetical protein